MVPNGWTLIKLKDIGKCITGLTYSPKNVVNDGLLVLRSSNIQDSKLSFNDNVYVDIEVDKKSKTQFGDILLCVRNGSKNLIGKSAFIYKENEQLAHGAFMSLFRSNETPDYTFQLFQSSQFFRQVNQNLGANINSINSGNLYQFKFPYPPFKEREKIAKILSTWDKAISTTERLIDNSKQQKKALMQQLLTGKKRLLDDSGKPFEGEWEEVKLESIVVRTQLGTTERTKENNDSNIVPLIKMGNLTWGGFSFSKLETVPKSIVDESLILQYGDFLFNTRNTPELVGKSAVWKGQLTEATFDNNINRITFNNALNTDFICFYLNHGKGKATVNSLPAGSTSVAAIYWKDLKNIKVPLPNIEEQTKIVSVLVNADQEIELLEQQLADLKQEKKALMQQLLTGKRRVTVS